MSPDTIAIIGVGVTLLGVLVLLLNMRAEIAELRWDLHALGERVAHIGGGAMSITGRSVSGQEVVQ
ncbi:MAG: hypothetical protein OXH85_12515 [Truepera sp.]|nr:hypothetical protein [Truepera sp.]